MIKPISYDCGTTHARTGSFGWSFRSQMRGSKHSGVGGEESAVRGSSSLPQQMYVIARLQAWLPKQLHSHGYYRRNCCTKCLHSRVYDEGNHAGPESSACPSR